jgi:hypothetical protein
MGQFTFAAAALACAAFLLFERARAGAPLRAAAGALFAAGAALKLFPLVALPALRRDRAARAAWLLAAAALAAATLAHALRWPLDLGRLAQANLAALSPAPQRGNFGMLYTLTALAREAGLDALRALYLPLARAWQASVLGAAALLAWRAPGRALALGAATLLAAFFLAYQDVWEHHYSGLVVAGLLIARGAAAVGASPAERALAWLALAALAAPTPFALLEGRADLTWRSWPGWQQWAVPLSKSGPLFALYALGLAALARAGSRPMPAGR